MFRGLYALPEGLVDLCLATALPPTGPHCVGLRKTSWRRGLSTNGKQRASNLEHSGRTRYVPTVGLELHVQLNTSVKLFSDAQTSYEAIPNTHVRPFDAALPGALPVLSAEPVRLALMAALALGCRIHRRSKFDRKHYFYPDLPAGFQITQKYAPLATAGKLSLTSRHDGLSESLDIGITQIQLEQDTAKSMHDTYTGQTLLDLNRAGTPLIEIISDPDLHTCEQAAAYVRKVQSILRCIGASDADMEKGSMRIDVNISVAPESSSLFGTRCEIKNLNSVRSMTDAITYEVQRQSALLEAGEAVEQQTRGFDASDGTTTKLRSKSDAPDYRYMPDPELAPLIIQESTIDTLKAQMPLLPDQVRDMLENKYDLTPREVDILVRMGSDSSVEGLSGLVFFEQVARGRKARTAANWILHDLLGQFTKHNLSFSTCNVQPEELAELIDGVESGKITSTAGKALLAAHFTGADGTPLSDLVGKAIEEASGAQVDYETLCAAVVAALPQEAAKVRSGNLNVLARLIGEGMKRSRSRAEPKVLRSNLLEALKK